MNELLSGLVTGPNLSSYMTTISLNEHDDLADCQNIATKWADLDNWRYYNSDDWISAYVRAMDEFGWTIDSELRTKTYNDTNMSLADYIVWTIKDSREQNAMIDTFDALKSNDPALMTLGKETGQGQAFQVMPVRYAQGNIYLMLMQLQSFSETEHGNFLFWNWEDRSTKIVHRTIRLKLDKEQFENKRARITELINRFRMSRFNLKKRNSFNESL